MDPGTTSGCWFKRTAGATVTYFGESSGVAGGLSGSGFVAKPAGVVIELNCTATNTMQTFSEQPIQIVATRVDALAANTTLPYTTDVTL